MVKLVKKIGKDYEIVEKNNPKQILNKIKLVHGVQTQVIQAGITLITIAIMFHSPVTTLIIMLMRIPTNFKEGQRLG